MTTTIATADAFPFEDERVVDPPPMDVERIDWATIDLPDAWADQMDWKHLPSLRRIGRTLSGRCHQRVELPAGVPGANWLPKYVLQEFHNLPNGNYSKCFSRGYAQGFDKVMLGTLDGGRKRVADALRGANCALDLGCGAGRQALALKEAGIPEVWGLDPSPYLLQYAARSNDGIQWAQGLAEQTRLADGQFDAVAVCFVFHEIPPMYLRKALQELARITRPGARLAVLEPSPLQWARSYAWLWRHYGWKGVYFRALAKRAYEPFAEAWHRQDFAALLAEVGFELIEDETACPFRFFLAQRAPSSMAMNTDTP